MAGIIDQSWRTATAERCAACRAHAMRLVSAAPVLALGAGVAVGISGGSSAPGAISGGNCPT